MTPNMSDHTLQWLHTLALDVNVFDTDCFGVMWHGAYTKWMEIGRVKLLEAQGLYLSKPNDAQGYVYPVVEQNFKFKTAAPFGDKLLLNTRMNVDGYKLIFHQQFHNQDTDKITLDATTTVVVLDSNWKLQRRLPEALREALGLA